MALNSTFNQGEPLQEGPTGEMSIDGSLIDKESPPLFVTHRRGVDHDAVRNLRAEMKSDFKEFQKGLASLVEAGFSKQDARLSQFMDEFKDIKTSIKFISDNYEDLKVKTDDVAQRVTTLETGTKTIQNNSSRIIGLETQLDILEQQARQCNIEINNLPEKRGENLTAILLDIAAAVKVPITKPDIVAIHRVPQASTTGQRPKNVIVKFSSRLTRDSFVSAIRLHKGITSEQLGIPGSSFRIYINEHLTLKNKNMFRRARDAAKQHGFRFVWVKHGSILVRRNESSPVFSVRSEVDLAKINTQVK